MGATTVAVTGPEVVHLSTPTGDPTNGPLALGGAGAEHVLVLGGWARLRAAKSLTFQLGLHFQRAWLPDVPGACLDSECESRISSDTDRRADVTLFTLGLGWAFHPGADLSLAMATPKRSDVPGLADRSAFFNDDTTFSLTLQLAVDRLVESASGRTPAPAPWAGESW